MSKIGPFEKADKKERKERRKIIKIDNDIKQWISLRGNDKEKEKFVCGRSLKDNKLILKRMDEILNKKKEK